jgi:hypothetical protein
VATPVRALSRGRSHLKNTSNSQNAKQTQFSKTLTERTQRFRAVAVATVTRSTAQLANGKQNWDERGVAPALTPEDESVPLSC